MPSVGTLKPGTRCRLPDGRRCVVTGRVSGSPLVRFESDGVREGPWPVDPELEVTDVEERVYTKSVAAHEVDPLKGGGDSGLLGRRKGKR